jgi:hypothetical protein
MVFFIDLILIRIAVCVVYIGKQRHNTLDLNIKGHGIRPLGLLLQKAGNTCTLTLTSSKFYASSVESTHQILGVPQTKRRIVVVCEML